MACNQLRVANCTTEWSRGLKDVNTLAESVRRLTQRRSLTLSASYGLLNGKVGLDKNIWHEVGDCRVMTNSGTE